MRAKPELLLMILRAYHLLFPFIICDLSQLFCSKSCRREMWSHLDKPIKFPIQMQHEFYKCGTTRRSRMPYTCIFVGKPLTNILCLAKCPVL